MEPKGEKLGHTEIYDLLTSKEVSWKSIIYDLINTEQLDPWDINITLLANMYLEKIKVLEEANFFVSSKILYAASLLLKLKSDSLLNSHLKSIDEILFGEKEELKKEEKLEMPENLPELNPKTPLPRKKKVSLDELMNALNKAMKTEKRRIRKEVDKKIAEKEVDVVVPETKPSIKDRIKKVYSMVMTSFKKKGRKIGYSELTGNKKEEKISCFLPCLHLHNQKKLFLEQQGHFSEIYIWLYKHFKKIEGTIEKDE